ncbi:MAG: endolytic transglycosylase MltG [Burkholderiales bacterium]
MLKTLITLVVAGLLGAGGYAAWYVVTPVGLDKIPLEFEVPAGARFRAVARGIEKSGVRVGRLQFELLARALGRDQSVKAGSYELSVPPTPLELLNKLTQGDVSQAELRFIEGWTFRQLRAALDASAAVKHETQGLSDAQIMARLKATEAHPEGLFFPDTYLFSKGASDLHILGRAYQVMHRHLATEWATRDPAVPYKTPYEALIMASIVEKETGKAAERDLIAGALVNRLRSGMLLQVDPTVIYGLGKTFDGNLKKAHLLADNPYNTYTRAGLPPTPIAAPGLASLRAALRPAKTDALYYVARGDGSSQFSRSLEEHNRAVRKYQLNGGR